MNVPDNLRYTESHEWVRREGDGTQAALDCAGPVALSGSQGAQPGQAASACQMRAVLVVFFAVHGQRSLDQFKSFVLASFFIGNGVGYVGINFRKRAGHAVGGHGGLSVF